MLQFTTCTAGTVTGARDGPMQYASPWQYAPQVWTGTPPQTVPTSVAHQIFIGGPTQQDMVIQSPQPIHTHNGRYLASDNLFNTVTNLLLIESAFLLRCYSSDDATANSGSTANS